jgi:hypothetical protein
MAEGPGEALPLSANFVGSLATGTDERSAAGSQLCQVAVIEHGHIGLYRSTFLSLPGFRRQLSVWQGPQDY